MSTELQQPIESGAEQGDLRIAEVEDAMASDEAIWKQQGRDGIPDETPARDEQGRFASADKAARAGQAKPDEEADGEESSGDNERSEEQQGTEQQPKAKAKPEAKPGEDGGAAAAALPKNGEGKPGDRGSDAGKPDNRSAWAKEQDRKAKSWEAINASKKEIEGQREQLKLERESFEASQKAASVTVRDAKGITVGQYEQARERCQARANDALAQAMEAETQGDYSTADRLRQVAQDETAKVAEANRRIEGLRAQTGGTAWQKLAADLPEALQYGGPINQAIRDLLKSNPALLGDPSGPFRAAVQVGRKVLQETTAQRDQFKAEAAKVPELQKQIAELSSKVQELTRLTSLPGAGGGAMSRSAGGEKPFEEMSLEEMEADLKRLSAA